MKELWVSARKDGIYGQGTEDNPFDASSSDKLIDIFNTKAEVNSVIHFKAGQYYLEASRPVEKDLASGRWTPQEGWDVRGAGIGQTIITQTGYDKFRDAYIGDDGIQSGGRQCLFSNTTEIDGFNIQDLTFDGGPKDNNNSSGVCSCFLDLHGRNLSARRIECKNFGNSGVKYGLEAFPIIFTPLYNQDTLMSNCVIEDCVARDLWAPATRSMTIFVIAGTRDTRVAGRTPYDHYKGADLSNVIRRCYIEFADGTEVGSCSAYTAPVVENCFARNVRKAVYKDTWSSDTLIVRNCRFENVAFGIEYNFYYVNPWTVENTIINNNYIALKNSAVYSPTYRGIGLLGSTGRVGFSDVSFENIEINNNIITVNSGDMHATKRYDGMYIRNANNVRIHNNVLADFESNSSVSTVYSGYNIYVEKYYSAAPTPFGPTVNNWTGENNYTTGVKFIPLRTGQI